MCPEYSSELTVEAEETCNLSPDAVEECHKVAEETVETCRNLHTEVVSRNIVK